MEQNGPKLRSVCDACTSAKLRCNGKVPCERCLKKGIECHYQPYKNRGGGNSSNGSKQNPKQNDVIDTFLNEHERRTWSVFFTLYRSFGKGCSQVWFQGQLYNMLRYLEARALHDETAVNPLTRLRSWMTALGLDVNASPPENGKALPHMTFPVTSPPQFKSTLEDLLSEAERRNLSTLTISRKGEIDTNESFECAFGFCKESLQVILDETGGGFLPWAGDLLARVFVREADLVLYLQAVSNSLEAIGKPASAPCTIVVPAMSLVKMRKRSGAEVLAMVRSVHQLYVETDGSYSHSSAIIFELPGDPSLIKSDNAVSVGSGRQRTFEEANGSTHQDSALNSNKRIDVDEILPLPMDVLGSASDEDWLDGLLIWAADSQPLGDMSGLPVADDMVSRN